MLPLLVRELLVWGSVSVLDLSVPPETGAYLILDPYSFHYLDTNIEHC
jgi:hypothetical protein